MNNRVFFDSNVWLYLFVDNDDSKAQIAENFLDKNKVSHTFIISYQVINEVSNVLKRKGFPEPDIRAIIELMSKICIIQDYSKEIALMASHIREKYMFSFWDSHIVAAAAAANCDILVSEDMQSEMSLENLVIKNIFAG